MTAAVETCLLVYTAIRAVWAAGLQHWEWSCALGVLLLCCTLVLAVPSNLQSLLSSVPGAKPTPRHTLLHGVLGFPCLLVALGVLNSTASTAVYASLEASSALVLWIVQKWSASGTPTSSHHLAAGSWPQHLVLAKIAYGTLDLYSRLPAWQQQPVLSKVLQVASLPGAAATPVLLEGVLHHLPNTFTVPEAMLVCQGLVLGLLAAVRSISAPASDTHDSEPHAAMHFTCVYGGLTAALTATMWVLPLPYSTTSPSNLPQAPTSRQTSSPAQTPGSRGAAQSLFSSVFVIISWMGVMAAWLWLVLTGATWVLVSLMPGTPPAVPSTLPFPVQLLVQYGEPWTRPTPPAAPATLNTTSATVACTHNLSSSSSWAVRPWLCQAPCSREYTALGMAAVLTDVHAHPANAPHTAGSGALRHWLGISDQPPSALIKRLVITAYWFSILGITCYLQTKLVYRPAATAQVGAPAARADDTGTPAGASKTSTSSTTPASTHALPAPSSNTSSSSSALRVPLIIVRKGFHLVALLILVPGLILDPDLLMVALMVAWWLLLSLELARARGVPVLGPSIHGYMSRFIDHRDGGAAFITHLALMLGLSAPTWLAAGIMHTAPGADDAHAYQAVCGHQPLDAVCDAGLVDGQAGGCAAVRLLLSGPGQEAAWQQAVAGWRLVALSGSVSIGVGDAVASVVGKLYGRHTLSRSNKKTWEGTIAGAISMLLCNAWALGILTTGSISVSSTSHARFLADVAFHTVLTSVLEAVTEQLDNLVVPLWHTTWMLLTLSHELS